MELRFEILQHPIVALIGTFNSSVYLLFDIRIIYLRATQRFAVHLLYLWFTALEYSVLLLMGAILLKYYRYSVRCRWGLEGAQTVLCTSHETTSDRVGDSWGDWKITEWGGEVRRTWMEQPCSCRRTAICYWSQCYLPHAHREVLWVDRPQTQTTHKHHTQSRENVCRLIYIWIILQAGRQVQESAAWVPYGNTHHPFFE